MLTMMCETCGADHQKPEAWARRTKRSFCSRQCYWMWRKSDPGIRKHLMSISAKGVEAGNTPEINAKKIHLGPDNPAWKGGVTYFRKHGNYKPIKYVRCPVDFLPMARMDGYVMEHRLKMARQCGYLLMRTEVVHHIDHDPQNNADHNLELWPDNASHKAAEHGRIVPGAACRFFPKVSVQP